MTLMTEKELLQEIVTRIADAAPSGPLAVDLSSCHAPGFAGVIIPSATGITWGHSVGCGHLPGLEGVFVPVRYGDPGFLADVDPLAGIATTAYETDTVRHLLRRMGLYHILDGLSQGEAMGQGWVPVLVRTGIPGTSLESFAGSSGVLVYSNLT